MTKTLSSSGICPVCGVKKPVLLDSGVEEIRICYACIDLLKLAYGKWWQRRLKGVIESSEKARADKKAVREARKKKVVN